MADDTDKPASGTPAESKAAEALPVVESPSISPAEPPKEPLVAENPAPIAAEPAKPAASILARPRIAMAAAASVVLAAALGGVFGGLAIGAMPKDHTAVHEREAMQRSLAQLTKDIDGLKTELAAADKNARAQTARVAELGATLKEKLARDQNIVTGSIAAPASAPVPPAAAATAASGDPGILQSQPRRHRGRLDRARRAARLRLRAERPRRVPRCAGRPAAWAWHRRGRPPRRVRLGGGHPARPHRRGTRALVIATP